MILDSNIFVSRHFDLTAPDFQVLGRAVELGIVTIIVPEIVIEEVDRKYREVLTERAGEASKAEAAISRMTGRPPTVQPSVAVFGDAFRARFDHWVGRLGVTVPTIASVKVEALVTRALKRRKPFRGTSDDGMRDAIIWEAVLELARTDDDEVVLVSQNTRDFATTSAKELHSDLRDDLEGAKANVSYVADLRALREKVLDEALREAQEEADLELATAYVQTLDLVGRFGEVLIAALEASLERALPSEFTEPSVPHLDPPNSITVEDAIGLGGRKVEVSLAMSFDVHAEGFAHKGDAYHLSDEQGIHVGNFDWNDWSSTMTYSDEATVEVSVVVNAELREVDGFQVTRVDWQSAVDPDSM